MREKKDAVSTTPAEKLRGEVAGTRGQPPDTEKGDRADGLRQPGEKTRPTPGRDCFQSIGQPLMSRIDVSCKKKARVSP